MDEQREMWQVGEWEGKEDKQGDSVSWLVAFSEADGAETGGLMWI